MTDQRQDLRDLVAAVTITRQELARAARLAETTLAVVAARAEQALSTGVEHPVQEPVTDLPPACAHRRNHRPGRPARIDADPELRAFILARIDRLTFVQLEEDVATAFPAPRRVGKSAIHAWWRRQ